MNDTNLIHLHKLLNHKDTYYPYTPDAHCARVPHTLSDFILYVQANTPNVGRTHAHIHACTRLPTVPAYACLHVRTYKLSIFYAILVPIDDLS